MTEVRVSTRSTRRILVALSALGGSEVAIRVLSVAVFVVVAQVLGAGPLGQLVAAQALVALAMSLSEGGVTTSAQRRVVRHPSRTPETIGATLLAQSMVCTCTTAVLIGVTTLLRFPSDDTRVAVWFLLPLLFVNAFNLSWALQAQRHYVVVARVRAIAQFLSTVLAITSVVAFQNVYAVLVSIWVSGLLADIYLYRVLRRSIQVRRPTIGAAISLLHAGWPFLMIALMSQVVVNYDLLLISATLGDEAAGTYSAAYRLLVVLVGLVGLVAVVLLPELIKLHAEAPAKFAHYVSLSLSLTYFASALAASLLITFASQIVRVLYGSDFEESATILTILGLSIPLSFLNGLLGHILIVLDQERRYLTLFAVTTTAAVVMVSLIVPREGLVGAAVVAVVVELVTFLMFARAVWHRCRFRIGGSVAFGLVLMVTPPLAAQAVRGVLGGAAFLAAVVACWVLVAFPTSLGFMMFFNRRFGVSFSGVFLRRGSAS